MTACTTPPPLRCAGGSTRPSPRRPPRPPGAGKGGEEEPELDYHPSLAVSPASAAPGSADGLTPTPKSKASEISLRNLPDTPGVSSAAGNGSSAALLGSPRPVGGGGNWGGGSTGAAAVDLTPRSARSRVTAEATADSLDAWSALQPPPSPGSSPSKRVTFTPR